MGEVFGDTRSLQASDRTALDKLAGGKCNPHEFIGLDLARRAGKICARLGVQIGLLVGRDGRVERAVLGTRDRIYLPDLGRYRLSKGRLRRLRFIVFLPEGQHRIEAHRSQELFYAKSRSNSTAERVLSPTLAADLLTDLEKLRFDAVAGIAVDSSGSPGPVSIVFIEPQETHSGPRSDRKNDTRRPMQGKTFGFVHARDIHEIGFAFDEFVEDLEARFGAASIATHKVSADQAVLVGVYTGNAEEGKASMLELEELARTADLDVLDIIIQRRREIDPRTVIGKGKIEEIVLHCLDVGANFLVFDRELTPGQLRTITNMTELRVIDRSMLILDIFAQRAKSSEGRVQVELAQLKYSLPRLTERDTGLSRLTGGIGGRGPGETKLEIGRRRSRDRIHELEKRIEQLANQRGVRRERRQSRGVPVIAIVGYTNAGKSTLLNALTKGDVLVENKLFATLDPSSRRMRFPNEKEVIFVDTVGFIRELPKELVTAFRATLEEVGQADVLVHVVDASNLEMRKQIEVVEQTLASLGFGDKPKVLVLNKTDLLAPPEVRSLERSLRAIAISALTREGFQTLLTILQEELNRTFSGRDPGRFTELPSW